ncbi:MAG: YihA family ribosome biogenesis GTP-binding protein [Odoribacter sp.]|nr:YihA family ribosome biogenesis GTP-binding protein [Odoribacter sp.]
MIIHSATFLKSSAVLAQCPEPSMPEFAFIGRSNVGKSSLINMVTGWSKLAKTSGQPGKTRTINHFIINEEWYLADLPGYGYARVSAKLRDNWVKEVENYIVKRENLVCLFVLLDCRIKPQESDLGFMEKVGLSQIPFARVFTKADKLKKVELENSINTYDKVMLEKWEELPPTFISSMVERTGREEILNFIEQSINNYKNGS